MTDTFIILYAPGANKEKENILYSLKAWQLGETSEGKHLLAAATKHAKKIVAPTKAGAG